MRPHADTRERHGAGEARRLPGSANATWSGLVAAAVLLTGVGVAFPAGLASAGAPLFGAPDPTAVAADTVQVGDRLCLTRRAEECLDEPVPADEPHQAICATCHTLWQRLPADETARSCSDSECHTDPVELASFHRTVHANNLENCLGCHDPHDARIEDGGEDCTRCHSDGGVRVAWAGGESLHVVEQSLGFGHGNHGGENCGSCHGVQERHGTIEVRGVDDCRSCHHAEPASASCRSCHGTEDFGPLPIMVTRTLDIRVGSLDRPERELPFRHEQHQEMDCLQCHTETTGLRPWPSEDGDCSSCHAEHHAPDSPCYSCHLPVAEGAHDVTTHLGCSGTGCHTDVPAGIASVPRTREMCLSCHTDLTDHEPSKNCSDCHILPDVPSIGR